MARPVLAGTLGTWRSWDASQSSHGCFLPEVHEGRYFAFNGLLTALKEAHHGEHTLTSSLHAKAKVMVVGVTV
jgi:hypothetical protein